MKFIDPNAQASAVPPRQPTGGSNFLFFAVAGIVLAFAFCSLLQEPRWRGAITGLMPSPFETRAQQLKLGEIAFRNGSDTVALSLFERLAANNDAAAQYWLAHMNELGIGVPKDIPKALSLYEKAASNGSIPALARLGEIYLNGDLVAPDYVEAF